MASALDLYRGLGLEYAPDRYLDLSLKGFGEGGGGRFCVLRVTKQIFTFSRFSKIEVVQNVKNVTLVPFCKTECFD